MGHNLNVNNGKVSFVAVGQVAWHGLGTYVEKAMTSQEAIETGGLNFNVEKRAIHTGDVEIPGFKATVRTDNGAPLGIVSDQYEIVQNVEAFEFFDAIIEKGEAIYQTAGVLGKGEKVFITAKLPEDFEVNGEQINNYLLLSSGHDGRSAIQVGFTPIRVVCNNTLNAALRGLSNRVSILHAKNAKEKLALASQVMGIASKYTKELDVVFNQMSNKSITDAELHQYIETVMKPQEVLTEEELKKGYSTRFINKVDNIMEFVETHPTQQTSAARGTLWGAYNAISGYYGYIKNYKNQEDKMQDLYFKGGSKKIEHAFNVAVAML